MEQQSDVGLVVTGDFNDGPGLDRFERLYLTHNVAGMIAGAPFDPPRMQRHAFVDLIDKEANYTVIFDDFIEEIPNRKLLLDHIFVSASLYWSGSERSAFGCIEHDAFEQGIDLNADGRGRAPNDHRACVPCSGVIPPALPPRPRRGGPRTSGGWLSGWRCKGWAGPFPWFENHLNQTDHAQDSLCRI